MIGYSPSQQPRGELINGMERKKERMGAGKQAGSERWGLLRVRHPHTYVHTYVYKI